MAVEDDPAIADLLDMYLRREDHRVYLAADGERGLELIAAHRPDVVILDVGLPGIDGLEVCRRIRASDAAVSVVFLTARDDEIDRVLGLEMGADDYVTKPFKVNEFLARVRSTMRRARMDPAAADAPTYADSYLTIDLEQRRVTVDGDVVKLTPTEYKLLAVLVRNKGRVLEFRQILEQVWGFEYIDDIDYLRVYIWHLRRKLEPDAKDPIYLLNELNTGYRFEPQR